MGVLVQRDAAGCARRGGRRNYQRSGVEGVPDWPSIRRGRNSGIGSLANWAARTSHPNREALRRKNLWSAVGLWLRHCGIPYLFPSLVKPRVVGDRMQDLEGGDRISDCAV